jgi:nitrogen fixation protein FixH
MKANRAWLFAIGGLLAVNVIAVTTMAVVANAGGAQIIPDYDVKASRFDAELTRDAANRRLGWRAAISIAGDSIEARVIDADGRPIEGARVEVAGYQRAHAAAPFDTVLAATGDAYRGTIHGRRGWYDVQVSVDARGAHFTQQLAIEAP